MVTPKQPASERANATALFRYGVIASLVGTDFDHGELKAELRRLAKQRWRSPGSPHTRTFGVSTLERWYYAYKQHGFVGLLPNGRSDRGRGRNLSDKHKQLLLQIRAEFPTASTPLIIDRLVRTGVLEPRQVSVATLNRLYAEHGLRRRRRNHTPGPVKERLRWEVGDVGALWHADVCHGPTLEADGRRTPLRIHALLDDKSRYVVALEVLTQEREVEMLSMLGRAIERVGVPRKLFVDNGSTYRGDALAETCSRLSMGLVHATPYDPQSRGKMERFWRTMREQCLDFVGTSASLHDVTVRVHAWLDAHYHRAPHAGLMGQNPEHVWTHSQNVTRRLDFDTLTAAFTTRARRRVRADNTLSVDGTLYQVDAGFLAGKVVEVARPLPPFDGETAPVIEYEGLVHELMPVDPVANASRPRHRLDAPQPVPTTGFDPNLPVLDEVTGRQTETESEVSP